MAYDEAIIDNIDAAITDHLQSQKMQDLSGFYYDNAVEYDLSGSVIVKKGKTGIPANVIRQFLAGKVATTIRMLSRKDRGLIFRQKDRTAFAFRQD